MKLLYIIPARGGSKGIPRKNIKPLGGKPLIAWTIEAAFAAGGNKDNIILSTDDSKIASAGEEYGLDVSYRRPAALGGDNVGSREVMLDVMDWADARGLEYEAVVLLQPTSPFRTPADIAGCVAKFRKGETDMAVSVCEAAANPYYDIFEEGADGTLHVSKGDGLITRRQDAPEVWQYNGAVYVIDPEALRRYPLGALPRRVAYPMPRERSVDLDTPRDWALAEMMLGESSCGDTKR